jgi:hypothetical protein
MSRRGRLLIAVVERLSAEALLIVCAITVLGSAVQVGAATRGWQGMTVAVVGGVAASFVVFGGIGRRPEAWTLLKWLVAYAFAWGVATGVYALWVLVHRQWPTLLGADEFEGNTRAAIGAVTLMTAGWAIISAWLFALLSNRGLGQVKSPLKDGGTARAA